MYLVVKLVFRSNMYFRRNLQIIKRAKLVLKWQGGKANIDASPEVPFYCPQRKNIIPIKSLLWTKWEQIFLAKKR